MARQRSGPPLGPAAANGGGVGARPAEAPLPPARRGRLLGGGARRPDGGARRGDREPTSTTSTTASARASSGSSSARTTRRRRAPSSTRPRPGSATRGMERMRGPDQLLHQRGDLLARGADRGLRHPARRDDVPQPAVLPAAAGGGGAGEGEGRCTPSGSRAASLRSVWPRGFERILARSGATLRPLDRKDFRREVDVLKGIYNAAWSSNWGFVPMTDAEFENMAKEFRPVADLDLCLIAELRGEPVGFSIALPDLNQALRHLPSGRLLPFGFLRFLWHRRKIHRLRVITLGLTPAAAAAWESTRPSISAPGRSGDSKGYDQCEALMDPGGQPRHGASAGEARSESLQVLSHLREAAVAPFRPPRRGPARP